MRKFRGSVGTGEVELKEGSIIDHSDGGRIAAHGGHGHVLAVLGESAEAP